MRITRCAFVVAVLSTLVLTSMCFAASADRITSPIVAAQTTRVANGVPLQAKAKFDQGRVDPNLQLPYITLLTVPTPAQHKALNELLANQQKPHSASYHKWLTPEEYADQFGLSQNDIGKLTAWLKSQGFSVVRTARARNWIVFKGTAAQVEKTFQTEIHTFKVDGETHFSNTSKPAIPAALKGVVTGFRGMNNFRPRPYVQRSKPQYAFPYQSSNYIFLAPGDLATIYNVNALYTASTPIDGTGQSVAVFGQTGIFLDDITNFRTNFGLSAISCPTVVGIITSCNTSNFSYLLVNGSATNLTTGGVLDEADIDIEYSGAIAPNAQIIYVNATDPNGGGVWDGWYYGVDNVTAPVMSLSYGLCELGEAANAFQGATGEFTFTSDEAELAQANSEGITFMNSSGDAGSATCDGAGNPGLAQDGYSVSYPASSVYITAVGGTLIPAAVPDEYNDTYFGSTNGSSGGSALSYVPEQPWNDDQELGLECASTNPPGFCADYGVTDWASAQTVFGTIAGGGGMSNCIAVDDVNGVCTGGFAQPSWQAGLNFSAINPSGAGLATSTLTRAVPDVSLLASPNRPGYVFCTQNFAGSTAKGSSCGSPTTGIVDMLTTCFNTNEGCSIAGGTSFASPIFAGMVALMNQDIVASGGVAGIGNINPTLYSLAATPGYFNPVTTGAGGDCTPNDPDCGTYSIGIWCAAGQPSSGLVGGSWPTAMQCPSTGNALLDLDSFNYDATTSYNLAVGLGSPNAANLVPAVAAAVVGSQGTAVTITCSDGCTQTNPVSAGVPQAYSFSIAPTIGSTFGANVSFSCSISPSDPTLTSSACTFSPSSVASGTSGAQTIGVTVATAGPNTGDRPANRKRADNRMPLLPFTLPIAGLVVVGFAGRKWSKYSVIASLCLALVMAGLLVACSSNSTGGGTSVSGVTASPASVYPNNTGWPSQTSSVTVTTNDPKGVTWTAGLGTIVSTGANTATYTAPTIASGLPASDTITATSVTNTSVSASGSITLTPATVPGTYTVTVTATSGSNTTTTNLTMVVQ